VEQEAPELPNAEWAIERWRGKAYESPTVVAVLKTRYLETARSLAPGFKAARDCGAAHSRSKSCLASSCARVAADAFAKLRDAEAPQRPAAQRPQRRAV
jgi:hypothetical protein